MTDKLARRNKPTGDEDVDLGSRDAPERLFTVIQ
jgi:hypothetical protein